LIAGLAAPASLEALDQPEWDALVPVARGMRLFSRLAALARNHCVLERLPSKIVPHFQAALRVIEHRQRSILWELHHLERTLGELDVPILALKGTGYLMAGLAVSQGRVFGDIDLLVPRNRLAEVEQALRAAGWKSDPLTPHDERYYREWMHEIPAMRHPQRQVEVDVHHSLSPLTSVIKVDATPLFEVAIPVAGHIFQVPAPEDMVLHSALHLFYGGEFEQGLRDLSDLDLLFREFSHMHTGFWEALLARAETLNLGRPLYYALRSTHRLLGTPVPEDILAESADHGPGRVAAGLMDRLLESALIPAEPAVPGLRSTTARRVLWLRSHWLKMPPGLLLYHLTHKLRTSRK
jgi:hypothetical protein